MNEDQVCLPLQISLKPNSEGQIKIIGQTHCGKLKCVYIYAQKEKKNCVGINENWLMFCF